MEVMGSNTHLEEPEIQTSANNYGCRLSRDSNTVSNSVRSKVENDIGLLVACKSQLSSEVIKWKTESLRLQKERDFAHQRTKELNHMISELSERTQELETRLSFAEDENEKLKSRNFKVDEDNSALMHRLSMSLNKYHSFPWSEPHHRSASSSRLANDVRNIKEVPQEDWKEVSQKLFDQMKQEMKELQELNNHFAHEKEDSETDMVFEENVDSDGMLQGSVSSLLYGTESLKAVLLEQKRKLEFMVNSFSHGNSLHIQENSRNGAQQCNTTSDYPVSYSTKFKSDINKYTGLSSDESFRAYFTKQLETFHDLDKVTKALQRVLKSSKTQDLQKSTVACNVEQKLFFNFPDLQPDVICSRDKETKKEAVFSKLQPDVICSGDQDTKTTEIEEERICPICQAPFGVIIPQQEFEEHVLDHLEVESASLLDQYVVL